MNNQSSTSPNTDDEANTASSQQHTPRPTPPLTPNIGAFILEQRQESTRAQARPAPAGTSSKGAHEVQPVPGTVLVVCRLDSSEYFQKRTRRWISLPVDSFDPLCLSCRDDGVGSDQCIGLPCQRCCEKATPESCYRTVRVDWTSGSNDGEDDDEKHEKKKGGRWTTEWAMTVF